MWQFSDTTVLTLYQILKLFLYRENNSHHKVCHSMTVTSKTAACLSLGRGSEEFVQFLHFFLFSFFLFAFYS